MTMTVYQELVQITTDYLGPAAERFVSRQITFHLEKKPEQITIADVPRIAERMKGSLTMLTQDKEIVDEAINRIAKISAH